MENKSLTPQELQTLNAYDTFLAKTRTTTHGDITFWQKQFHLFTSFLPSGTILDLGCGAGRDALLFATNTAYRYVGVDLSSKMLEEARKIAPEADFREMSMYALDFPDRTFDGFWAAASLLHIPKRDLNRALGELRRVVKSKGIGFIAVKEGKGERMIETNEADDERFFAFYSNTEFAGRLNENGFRILKNERDTREYNPPKNLNIWLWYIVEVV